ncbi:MAG: VIT1/CCC1 transporter family protein [Chroococcidiopsidaceae cyanobacterium CP_BM_ER_R8_30]|nr:VIT1/CCC1 transporter family protein [Chroococcidiopsidaceae cyanobacterium CP_BM_ER_R8_30]
MNRKGHRENHIISAETVRDIILGMSDGLTVPFALAAGLAGAISQSSVVVAGGLSEIAAGAISMGLGGYLAAQSEADTYRAELAREHREVREVPHLEAEEVREILASYGLAGETLRAAVQGIISDQKTWVHFMMREELGLEKPDPKRATSSALTIGGSYIAGGFVPLAPYFFSLPVETAFFWSIVTTSVALFVFGAVKGKFTSVPPLKSALQTLIVGSVAATAAYGLARLVGGHT